MQPWHHVLTATLLAAVSGGITWAINATPWPWATGVAVGVFVVYWVGLAALVVVDDL